MTMLDSWKKWQKWYGIRNEIKWMLDWQLAAKNDEKKVLRLQLDEKQMKKESK